MASERSLEFLLRTLVNIPEQDKRTLVRSAVSLLREVCNIQTHSPYTKFQETAKEARGILDQVLIGQMEDEEEEEFLESGDEPHEVPVSPPVSMVETPKELSGILQQVKSWNEQVEPWFHLATPEQEKLENNIVELIYSASAIRSNLATASLASRRVREDYKRFDQYWQNIAKEMEQLGFELGPSHFGRLEQPQGQVIYSARGRLENQENALILPGLSWQGKELLSPVTLVTLPSKTDFPPDHPHADLPVQWRAILGELELLQVHLQIQSGIVCSLESINQNKIEPLTQCREAIENEIKRRATALAMAIRKQESIYRIATNYWRVEECFWSIFHGDGRPWGYSFFDRLRRRVQGWRNTVRLQDKLMVRDFKPGQESLTSINKYVGNVLFQQQQGVQAGTVLREIRPSVIVKADKITRLLKGRVIST